MLDYLAEQSPVSAADEAKRFMAASKFYLSLTKKAGACGAPPALPAVKKVVDAPLAKTPAKGAEAFRRAAVKTAAGPLSFLFSKGHDAAVNLGRAGAERAGMFTTGMLNRESKTRGLWNIIRNKGNTNLNLADDGNWLRRMRERWNAVKYPEYSQVHARARKPIEDFERVYGKSAPADPTKRTEWMAKRQNAVQKMHDLKNVYFAGKEVGEGSGAAGILANMRRVMPQGGMTTPTGVASALLRSGTVTPESFVSAAYKLKGSAEAGRNAAQLAKRRRNIILGTGAVGGGGLAYMLHKRSQPALPPAQEGFTA